MLEYTPGSENITYYIDTYQQWSFESAWVNMSAGMCTCVHAFAVCIGVNVPVSHIVHGRLYS